MSAVYFQIHCQIFCVSSSLWSLSSTWHDIPRKWKYGNTNKTSLLKPISCPHTICLYWILLLQQGTVTLWERLVTSFYSIHFGSTVWICGSNKSGCCCTKVYNLKFQSIALYFLKVAPGYELNFMLLQFLQPEVSIDEVFTYYLCR